MSSPSRLVSSRLDVQLCIDRCSFASTHVHLSGKFIYLLLLLLLLRPEGDKCWRESYFSWPATSVDLQNHSRTSRYMACGGESINPTSSTSTIELLIFCARSARAHLSYQLFSDCGLYNDRLHARGATTFNFFFEDGQKSATGTEHIGSKRLQVGKKNVRLIGAKFECKLMIILC